MARKTKPRFAIPSQFDSDDDVDSRTKSTRTDSSQFQPGQLFAQARKDDASEAKKDNAYESKNNLSSNKTTSLNASTTSSASTSSLPSATSSSSLPSATSSSSLPSTASSLPSTSSAFSSRKAAVFGANKTPSTTSSASLTSTATVPSTTSSSTLTAPSASSSSSKTAPSFSGGAKKNAMVVNPKQRGNPILKFVTNVPWEYGDIVPDYQVGLTACVLFLSLRYHNLNPDYIHKRLDDLKNMYELRVLLVQVDVNDPHHTLKELALLCILANCTLMVAWTPEEAGKYLETYKSYESKPPDAIMARAEDDFQGQMADALTTVKGINKTDATTLLSTFDSLANIIECEEDKLLLCPGLGPLKAKRLHQLFDTPFKNWK